MLVMPIIKLLRFSRQVFVYIIEKKVNWHNALRKAVWQELANVRCTCSLMLQFHVGIYLTDLLVEVHEDVQYSLQSLCSSRKIKAT